jgi:hypothetical protein
MAMTTEDVGPKPPRIVIQTLQDLHAHEQEILQRIAGVRNGGALFLIHPFQLLADVGVDLSETTKTQILDLEPSLSTSSTVAYAAFKNSGEQQHVTVTLHGLFRRG